MENKYLSIVIPAYNEEKDIRRNVLTVLGFLENQDWEAELIVADDGSQDNTVSIVETLLKSHPRLKLLRLKHQGKGPTVTSGILAAAGKYVLFSDADLATPIEEVKRLLVWATEHSFDIVIASREGMGAKREGEPLYRHLMGRVFNILVRIVTGLNFKDTQCGFKLFTRQAAQKVFKRLIIYAPREGKELSQAFLGAFDVEFLVIAQNLGYKIKDVSVPWHFVETPRLNVIRDSFKMLRDVVKVRLNSMLGKYKQERW